MNRPGRLIEKENGIKEAWHQINYELEPGDECTGFEIISMLPLEQQKETRLGLNDTCPKEYGLKNNCNGQPCETCISEALSATYRYNGNGLEAI